MGKDISIASIENQDYFSLTDMVRDQEGDRLIKNWLGNKKTIEFLAEWESLHNKDFNWVLLDPIKKVAGKPNFNISTKSWIEQTKSIGLQARSGRYGGTYAHADIAFHFAMWVSPQFSLAVIKDYQRLKKQEVEKGPWNAKRLLAKVNFRLQTDAIKDFIIPFSSTPEVWIYASESDLINLTVFGKTAAQWEKENPELAKTGNMRDHADLCQLSVLANMESFNSMLVARELPREEREKQLYRESHRQLQSMYKAELNKKSYLN